MSENRRYITLGCRVIIYKHSKDARSGSESEPTLFDEVCERADYLENQNAEMLAMLKTFRELAERGLIKGELKNLLVDTNKLIKKVEGKNGK